MKTLVLQKEIEPLPIAESSEFISNYEGILTSEYKDVAKHNYFSSKPNTIFGVKQQIKSRLYNSSLNIGALLKLSVFVIVLTAIV